MSLSETVSNVDTLSDERRECVENCLAAVCADACEASADECEQHDHDHCQVCADVLRDCAETCREMASG